MASPTSLEMRFGADFIHDIIQWIGQNVDIEDVYTEAQVRDYITESAAPIDFVDEDALVEWAEANGYTKDED